MWFQQDDAKYYKTYATLDILHEHNDEGDINWLFRFDPAIVSLCGFLKS